MTRTQPIRKTAQLARWGIAIVGLLVICAVLAAWMASGNLSRIARDRAISAVKENFASDLDFQNLDVSVFPRVVITGDMVVLHYKGRTDLPPLISMRRFTAEANLMGILREPAHISRVTLEGLQINVPPRGEAGGDEKGSGKETPNFVIGEIVADGTVLRTLPRDAVKEPLEYEIRRLRLHGAGSKGELTFHATLHNAKPPGDIQSTGKFGPWAKDEPGDTPVSGDYTFRNADLSVFHGISGMLSSDGNYHGVLQNIEVEGHTDTPDFTVKVSGNPVHLTTQFKAVVDGTDGDTLLQPVNGQFGRSSLTAQGGIEGTKGVKGKTVTLDVIVHDGRLEDMLLLGVKGKKPTMTGAIRFRTKLVIPPGDIEIPQKLKLDGGFEISAAHFSQLNVQEKVNKLSHAGKGEPEEPETNTVASDFRGNFALDGGIMTFRKLSFRVPGVGISLNGKYGLLDEQLDFHGTARLEAKLSDMTTGFKSFLLKAVDPLFKKKNAGAELPIKITGTRDDPSFGLDLRP